MLSRPSASSTLEFVQAGEGPPVLLLHGAMGGYDQGVLLGRAALGNQAFRSIAVSRPGYLGTPLDLGQTPEQQADLCAALLDALAVPETAILAISGGGQCALQCALRHPARCRALVLISACSAPLSKRPPLAFHIMTLTARVPLVTEALRNKALRDPYKAASRAIPDPELRSSTLNHPEAGPLLQELQLTTLTRLPRRLPGTRNDIRHSRLPFAYPFEKIYTPTLIVHGTADNEVPFADSQSLASRLPQRELLALEGGGHVALFTHLDPIRSRVLAFLRKHSPAGAIN